MTPFPTLLATELRRALGRRVVRNLVLVAVLGIALTATLALLRGGLVDLATAEDPAITRLADLWDGDERDGVILQPIVLLVIGALLGGAVVVGGEWKAGTVAGVLAWEPRRVRLLAARLAACSVLAMAIALALLVAFVAVGVLPAAIVHGDAGVDGGWVVPLLGVVARALAVIGLAAALGAAIASLARSSTAALAAVFVYTAVVEPVVRGAWPSRRGWLFTESVVAWVSGQTFEADGWARTAVSGGATAGVYVAAVAAVALLSFRRRDVDVA